MTQESPQYPKEDYMPHKPSEENGLVEDLDLNHDPEYLLEEEPDERETTFQLDFGYFFSQKEIFDYT